MEEKKVRMGSGHGAAATKLASVSEKRSESEIGSPPGLSGFQERRGLIPMDTSLPYAVPTMVPLRVPGVHARANSGQSL